MALARDQERIAGQERIDPAQDRLGAVGDLGRLGAALHHRGADRGGVFGPRVVVGHDDHIREGGGGLAHQRPFQPVAVAARAEDHDDAAKDMGPQRLQRRGERARLV